MVRQPKRIGARSRRRSRAIPSLRRALRAYTEQNRALHEAFDSVLDEPHSLTVPPARDPCAWNRWGGTGGDAVHRHCMRLPRPAGWLVLPGAAPTLATEAVLAHAAYVPEVRHPVEVGGGGGAAPRGLAVEAIVDTASRRHRSLTAGYQLLGGRLLPPTSSTDPAPIALLMYENAQGQRLSLLIKRDSTNTETAFRFSEDGANARLLLDR